MKLHEQTQRFILLLIFYLFGPIMTLGIIGGIVVRKHSSHARCWERALTQQTGLHWEIKSVEYCSPRSVRLHDVYIQDEITQNNIFYTKKIDIRLVADASRSEVFPGIAGSSVSKNTGLTALLAKSFPAFNSANQYWQISVPMSLLNFEKYSSEDSAALVQNILRKLLARLDTLADVPVQLNFEHVAIASEYSLKKPGDNIEEKVDIFCYVQGNIYRTTSETRSDWAFQIKGVSELDWKHRERLSFALSQPDTLDISFQSGRQPIPCDLAAVFCASFKHFSGGSFYGQFGHATHAGSKSPTIRLDHVFFKNVPLAPLVGPYTDFAVDGTIADLRFTQAVFGADGTQAEGCLQVQNGTIEKALFHRCVDRFQLTIKPDSILDSPIQKIPFTACVIHFRMQPGGIDFWADQLWRSDSFMYYQENPSAPYDLVVHLPTPRRTVSYHELMSIFASDGAPVVPLTHGMKNLVPLIPLR